MSAKTCVLQAYGENRITTHTDYQSNVRKNPVCPVVQSDKTKVLVLKEPGKGSEKRFFAVGETRSPYVSVNRTKVGIHCCGLR